MITNSNKFPNYAAAIRKVDDIIPIDGMDTLVYAIIGVEKVLVSKNEIHKGDIVLFVPCEATLSDVYLKTNNLYSNGLLNKNAADYEKVKDSNLDDKTKQQLLRKMRGYFGENRRVTLLKLRGMYSQGYVAPVRTIESAYPETKGFDWEAFSKGDDDTFDTINGKVFCEKYVRPVIDASSTSFHKKKYSKREPRKFDYLIPSAFPAHYNTSQLRDSIKFLHPNDVVDITVKVHGTSFFTGNVPCNHKLSLWEKIKSFFGMNVQLVEYRKLFSSRKVVINQYGDDYVRNGSTAPYAAVFEMLKPYLTDENRIIYGEICGFNVLTGSYLQANHDYGCSVRESGILWKFMPYRISDVNIEGHRYELEIDEVIDWTNDMIESCPKEVADHLMPLNKVFSGELQELVPFQVGAEFDEEAYDAALKDWRVALYAKLQESFGLEKDEPMCKNKVPREGIVIRRRGDRIPSAIKLKSNAHYELAKVAHDKGVADIEEDQ